MKTQYIVDRPFLTDMLLFFILPMVVLSGIAIGIIYYFVGDLL